MNGPKIASLQRTCRELIRANRSNGQDNFELDKFQEEEKIDFAMSLALGAGGVSFRFFSFQFLFFVSSGVLFLYFFGWLPVVYGFILGLYIVVVLYLRFTSVAYYYF